MAQSSAVRSSPVSRSPSASVPSAPAGGAPKNASAPPPDSGPFDIGIARERRRGRGTLSNVSGRYEPIARIAFDDGWQSLEELPPFATTVSVDSTRKIITRNESPDISFDRSINPYRGCEHGCVYCFARPTHAYLGLSPGLDFETKLFAKPDAPALLEKELSDPKYQPRTIAIGTNTDPYQPIERKYQVMRGILEVLERAGHPVGIVTKSALILRDLDILTRLAERNLVKVALSVTTLDPKLARTMEPRAATPGRRLEALRQLSAAGIPCSVMVAPVIPAINDMDIERILDAAAMAGVKGAGYVMLRLPLEVRDLFVEWLRANYPDRADHVMKLVRDMRGGKDYDFELGYAHDRRRAVCLDDRAPFRERLREAWPQQAQGAAQHRAFPLAEAAGRAAQPVCMTVPSPKLTAVTLGVRDVPASARFYEALGFKRKFRATGDEIAFFDAGGVVLALWSRDKLAEDAVVSSQPGPQMFGGTTLAWNCATLTGGRCGVRQGDGDRRQAFARSGKNRLRRLPGIFFRSGWPCLGDRPGARLCVHGRRTAHPSRLAAGFPRHSQARFCRI